MADRGDLQKWMEPVVGFDDKAFILPYVAELELGSYRFADLFKELRPYVEDDQDLPGIARALSILPPIFKELQDRGLPMIRSDLQLLLPWLCLRISTATVDPSLRAGLNEVIDAVRAISLWEGFVAEDAVDVITAIFKLGKELEYKDLKFDTRRNILHLLQQLFNQYSLRFSSRPGVSGFVNGLLDLAQFEKTPICLEIILSLFTQISKEWAPALENQKLAQKIFDSFARYFPVDVQRNYRPDPNAPALGDVATLLQGCYTASSIFADFAFGQLIELLDSAQEATKVKVLDLMRTCVSSYGIIVVQKWCSKIWKALKYEIWQDSEETIVQASLHILKEVAKVLGTEDINLDNNQSSLIRFINEVGIECNSKTQDGAKWMVPNGRIFHALADSCPRALYHITKSTIPKMEVKWQDTALVKEKFYILTSLNHIIRAHYDVYEPLYEFPYDAEKRTNFAALQACHNQINSMYDDAIQIAAAASINRIPNAGVSELYLHTEEDEDLLNMSAVEGLALLVQIPRFYEGLARGDVVKSIIRIHAATAHEGTRLQCVSVLKDIATGQPGLWRNTILDELLKGVPDQFSDRPDRTGEFETIEDVLVILDTITEIGCSEVCKRDPLYESNDRFAGSYWHTNFDGLMHELLLRLQRALQSNFQYDYAILFLTAISRALSTFEKTVDAARASPDKIEPPARRPEEGPYKYIVMALFKLLQPAQQRHERGAHTTEIEWYTYIRHFPGAKESQVDSMVQLVGEITLKALRSNSTTDENNFLLQWNDDAENNDCSALSSLFTQETNDCDMMRMDEWQPDVRRGPGEKCLANVLAMYIVAGTRRYDGDSLGINYWHTVRHMMKGYIGYDIEARTEFREGNFDCSPLSRQSMLWYAQLLVNKFGIATSGDPGNTAFDLLERYVAEARSSTAVTPMPRDRRERVLQVLAYFTAALLAAFDGPIMVRAFELMKDCLADPAPFGGMAARLYRITLAPSHILRRENFCKVRGVAPSWVLENIIPRLIILWRGCQDSTIKQNYLIAMASLLEFINPRDYVADMGEEALPAILEGTNIVDNAPAKHMYLVAINEFIKFDRKAVQEHILTVFRGLRQRLLNTLDDPFDSPVKCRIAAVEVLKTVINSYDREDIYLFRTMIEQEIDMACDDPSPAVRRRGSEAGTLWRIWLTEQNGGERY